MQPRSIGLSLLAGFFAFGTAMCSLTVGLILVPGTPLDVMWRLNPEAQAAFTRMGMAAVPLMLVVGSACAGASVGILRRREWGRLLGIVVLGATLVGDAAAAFVRRDPRTLLGLPLASLLIWFLIRKRPEFVAPPAPEPN